MAAPLSPLKPSVPFPATVDTQLTDDKRLLLVEVAEGLPTPAARLESMTPN
jgi:hypothetical protein